ncbi:MAG: bifunctional response regulator/alkaline phosphatase family protein [Paludibacteraceae bacterium]|nr:bifunctional response regulator/alkaline phosphatase family protein [Paludibacteraceae bacterium]
MPQTTNHRYHILWADDEIQLLQPYLIFLDRKGYDVTAVCSGRDAVDLCETQTFDIVFLDEQMPGLSGLETLQEIKRLQPAMPIVMITKSEEENIMEQAIGQHITDYLIKPVHPNQILMCLKKHIHSKEIVTAETNKGYQEEFSDIGYMISTANTLDEFIAIHKTLVHWDLQLHNIRSSMRDILSGQRKEANSAWAKFIIRNYEDWFTSNDRPMMSPDLFKKVLFPMLDNGEKLFFIVIDNFRYDQWKTIEPLLSQWFTITDERLYPSILPTATQYARNAIFAGLMPLQIEEMWPDLWVDEESEDGKNLNEKDLISTHLERYRKHYDFTYYKINNSDFCEKITPQLRHLTTPLNVVVINFIDMLSHSRTDSKMMRELMGDEDAYRSLTRSWFEHSPTYQMLRTIAELGYKIVLTTDHGTIRVDEPVTIIGDKNTNTNLRYKVGKSLTTKSKNCFEITRPKQVGLPTPNVSSSYVFCTGNDFFAYPNNFNYYAQYYRDTFQHGGISMEEMLIPLVTLQPKH